MNTFIAVIAMILWSAGIAFVMQYMGFADSAKAMHDAGSFMQGLWSSLGAAVVLLIGLIGNAWIFFLIAKDAPWQWRK